MKRRFWACTMIASLLVFNMPVNVLAGCSGGTADKTCTNWQNCYGTAQRVFYLANIACGAAFSRDIIDCEQKDTDEAKKKCRAAAVAKKALMLGSRSGSI